VAEYLPSKCGDLNSNFRAGKEGREEGKEERKEGRKTMMNV
jgi:hypothetical protein